MEHDYRQRTTSVIICADDFGLAPAMSEAILELCNLGRISATSCMVLFPEVKLIKDLQTQRGIDVGLHFTMTDFSPLSAKAKSYFNGQFPRPNDLFIQTLQHKVPSSIIQSELERQFCTLQGLLGRPPDFIDGHHHIHQYPHISKIVAEFCSEQRQKGVRLYVRTTHDSLTSIFRRGQNIGKSVFLSLIARRMRIFLDNNTVPYNTSFSGAYDFSDRVDYSARFRRMLKYHKANGLIMCHPGKIDKILESRDSTIQSRLNELRYFLSNDFSEDIAAFCVKISRFDHGNTLICRGLD